MLKALGMEDQQRRQVAQAQLLHRVLPATAALAGPPLAPPQLLGMCEAVEAAQQAGARPPVVASQLRRQRRNRRCLRPGGKVLAAGQVGGRCKSILLSLLLLALRVLALLLPANAQSCRRGCCPCLCCWWVGARAI